MLFLFISISTIFVTSCGNDNDPEGCRNNGSLSATWSDGQSLKFNHNVFSDEANQKVSLRSFFDADFCAQRIQLSILKIDNSTERQQLKRDKQNGFFEEGTSFISTTDTDALTESYELDTLQPHWIEIRELGPNQLIGIINATFVIDENVQQKAWNYPDTLRFKEENFELTKSRE